MSVRRRHPKVILARGDAARIDPAHLDPDEKRRDRVVEREGQWFVVSEAGEDLDGPFSSQAEAAERLRQIEAAKAAQDQIKPAGSEAAELERVRGIQGITLGSHRLGSRIDRGVQRWDRLELRLDASTVVRHENGWMDVSGVATRSGVFVYLNADGSESRELRPKIEVFDRNSLETLKGIPFTNDHPVEPLDSANTRVHQVGTVLEVAPNPEQGVVGVRVRITDKPTNDEVLAGKIELSGGYTTDVVDESGTVDGERFDAIQTNIRYNHLALVDEARAGPVARLRLDGAQQVKTTTIKLKGKTYTVRTDKLEEVLSAANPVRLDQIETVPITIGDVELVLPASMVAKIEAMVTGDPPPPVDAPAAAEDILEEDPDKDEDILDGAGKTPPPTPPASPVPGAPAVKTDKTTARRLDALIVGRLEKLEKRLDAVPAEVQAKIHRRGELERKAGPILGLAYRYDQADDAKLMGDTIKAIDEELSVRVDANTASPEFLRGMFELAVERFAKDQDQSYVAHTATVKARKDGAEDKVDAAKARYEARLTNPNPPPAAPPAAPPTTPAA